MAINPESGTQDFTAARHGEVTVATLGEGLDILDEAGVEILSDLLIDLAEQMESPLLVVDLGYTRFFGTRFLELLLRLWNRLRKEGGELALCNLSGHCREILRVSRLDMVWPIYDDQEQAVEALQAES